LAQLTNNAIPADGGWKGAWTPGAGRARATGQRFSSGQSPGGNLHRRRFQETILTIRLRNERRHFSPE
jgi:hypothetical protein